MLLGLGQPPLGLENFSQKSQILNFFPFGKKISFGRVKKYPRQRLLGPKFTECQKYAWVGSVQGPSLAPNFLQ